MPTDAPPTPDLAAAQAAFEADTNAARERRREAFQARHRTASLADMARESGLSKTRVAQILRGE